MGVPGTGGSRNMMSPMTVKMPVTTTRLSDLSVCTSHERENVRKFMTRTCAHTGSATHQLVIGDW
jgi:hypothetical protein